jgi:hypothetical protein
MIKKLLNIIFMPTLMLITLVSANITYAAPNTRILTSTPIEVTITNQSFVFKEAFGSIEDDFEDVFKDVENFIRQNGASSNRRAILYLDYGVERVNRDMFRSAINIERPLIEYLKEIYGESSLRTYRRVLVGYLVPPQYFVSPREPFKSYDFRNIKVLSFQSMDKNVKTPLSLLTDPSATPPANVEEDTYTKADRVYDKLTMMNYLSLNIEFKNNIGMMEMYDTVLNVYTFMAIPGNQATFLSGLGISPMVSPGTFPRRPDIDLSKGDTPPAGGTDAGTPATNADGANPAVATPPAETAPAQTPVAPAATTE